jgi:hypothetical protein
LAPFSFAAGNFSRQRVEARQPGCPEPVEPVVDVAKPAGLHRVDAARANSMLRDRAGTENIPREIAMSLPDLDIYRAVRSGILDGIVICAGGE